MIILRDVGGVISVDSMYGSRVGVEKEAFVTITSIEDYRTVSSDMLGQIIKRNQWRSVIGKFPNYVLMLEKSRVALPNIFAIIKGPVCATTQKRP